MAHPAKATVVTAHITLKRACRMPKGPIPTPTIVLVNFLQPSYCNKTTDSAKSFRQLKQSITFICCFVAHRPNPAFGENTTVNRRKPTRHKALRRSVHCTKMTKILLVPDQGLTIVSKFNFSLLFNFLLLPRLIRPTRIGDQIEEKHYM
jgi:hypothetical protein